MGLTENVQNQENKELVETLLIIETSTLQHFIPRLSRPSCTLHARTHAHPPTKVCHTGPKHSGWVSHAGWVRSTLGGSEALGVGQRHSEWVKGDRETLGDL